MSFINDKQLRKIWKIMATPSTREIIRELSIKPNTAYTYTELLTLIRLKIYPQQLPIKANNGKTAYHIRKMLKSGVFRKDDKYYFLSRIGLECVKVIKNFERLCKEFNLDDCDADGKIEVLVKRYSKPENRELKQELNKMPQTKLNLSLAQKNRTRKNLK